MRLLLCNKAILVEGDSDELIVQKAYIKTNGKLPIENGIDVISVGTSFLRFLEIAEKVNKTVCVVTDNDGNVEALKDKYKEYLGNNAKDFIKICFDSTVDAGDLEIGDKKFNYNTLEPTLLKSNSVEKFNTIFETAHQTEDDMHKYMKANNAWVWPDPEKGHVRHTSKHPDQIRAIKAKQATKEGQNVKPGAGHKTQVAVNNDGKTNEATKHAQGKGEPLKSGQTNPTAKQDEKKKESQQRKQSPAAPKKGKSKGVGGL